MLFLDKDIYNFILFLVGGGAAFGSTIPTSGAIQTIAAGLVPTGLTPVAFFPPSPTQQLQALSVIFLEAPLKKRKKRFAKKGSFKFYRKYVKIYPHGRNFSTLRTNTEYLHAFRLDYYQKDPGLWSYASTHFLDTFNFYTDPGLWSYPSPQFLDTINFYKNNLRRFTNLIRRGDFAKILEPAKFSTGPPNNLDLIMKLAETHFAEIINATRNR